MDAAAKAEATRIANGAKRLSYPDYESGANFPLWMQGLREKTRIAFGYTQAQGAEISADIVKIISSKLKSGAPLDTYNGLTNTEKGDYDQMVSRLTEEFLDPQEKDRFNESLSFNKRKKGQSIKNFIQEIKKDQNRYSGMPDFISVGDDQVPNRAKIVDGIQRFRKGIRNRNGEKDKSQQEHLRYNLHKDADLTWEHALNVACRWEAAHDVPSSSGSECDDDGDDDEAANNASALVPSQMSGKVGHFDSHNATSVTTIEQGINLMALASKVEANTEDIKALKSDMECMSAEFNTWKEEKGSEISEIVQFVRSQRQQPNVVDNEEYYGGTRNLNFY